jgi:hypothetical protein
VGYGTRKMSWANVFGLRRGISMRQAYDQVLNPYLDKIEVLHSHKDTFREVRSKILKTFYEQCKELGIGQDLVARKTIKDLIHEYEIRYDQAIKMEIACKHEQDVLQGIIRGLEMAQEILEGKASS